MKKIILGLVAASSMLVACDPVEESGSFDFVTLSESEISDCIKFTVYKDEACTQPAGPAEGNYVKFTTSPATQVSVFNYAADGSENILAWGSSGKFKLSPKRGSSNDQEVTVRVVNADNVAVDTKKTLNVWVKADLDPELKLLLGEAGKKKWLWCDDGKEVWGNAGHTGSGAGYKASEIDGKWWGVKNSTELDGQMNHANGDETLAALDAQEGSYMVFDEDNNIISYTADGKQIRKASYQFLNYNPDRNSGWELGKLTTSAPAVLFPYSINENGKQLSEFDVMYLDGNHMILVNTKGQTPGGWGEITYWRFVNGTPSAELLEANGGKWGWATSDDVEIWGNAGNTENGAAYKAKVVDGKWWGVKSGTELVGQSNHAGDDLYAQEDDNAYMVFADGKINTYSADGKVLRSAKYEIELNKDGERNNGWELGKLRTSEPALLFPWAINKGGKSVTEFDIMYMDGSNIVLAYTGGAAAWSEITYWRFEAK